MWPLSEITSACLGLQAIWELFPITVRHPHTQQNALDTCHWLLITVRCAHRRTGAQYQEQEYMSQNCSTHWGSYPSFLLQKQLPWNSPGLLTLSCLHQPPSQLPCAFFTSASVPHNAWHPKGHKCLLISQCRNSRWQNYHLDSIYIGKQHDFVCLYFILETIKPGSLPAKTTSKGLKR